MYSTYWNGTVVEGNKIRGGGEDYVRGKTSCIGAHCIYAFHSILLGGDAQALFNLCHWGNGYPFNLCHWGNGDPFNQG
jgi:hypothetical protein